MSLAPDRILISRGPGETRAALLAGEDVIELAHRRDGAVHPGACVVGRVVGRAPGFAFVDIGAETPGVLKTKTRMAEGAAVTVRIVVPPRADKGAELARADRIAPAPDPAAVWWQRHRNTVRDVVVHPPRLLPAVRAALGDAPATAAADDPFVAEGVDAAIEAALAPIVPLPGGARLIIEPTAAAIVIDVDAGPLAPAAANAAAIPAIARELRRRNLAGHILIDAIPTGRGGAKALLAPLQAALADDPVPSQIAGVTPLGMIELTRRREGLSLSETLADPVASAAYAALRAAVRAVRLARSASVTIAADAAVVARMQGPLRSALAEAEDLGPCTIVLHAREGQGPATFDVQAR